MKKRTGFGSRQGNGWVDALAPAKLDMTTIGYSDAVLYDATGKRIGVMDRATREKKYDA